MSLAGFDAPKNSENGGIIVDNEETDQLSFAFKIDDDDDDITLSIEKLKMQVSALLGDEDCKDIMDTDPLLSKDKSTCSTSELEMIRRERNRMHAKKTRLRKKKMIQEMETVSTCSPAVLTSSRLFVYTPSMFSHSSSLRNCLPTTNELSGILLSRTNTLFISFTVHMLMLILYLPHPSDHIVSREGSDSPPGGSNVDTPQANEFPSRFHNNEDNFRRWCGLPQSYRLRGSHIHHSSSYRDETGEARCSNEARDASESWEAWVSYQGSSSSAIKADISGSPLIIL